MIGNILYTLFIYPIENIIEIAFLFAWRVFKSTKDSMGLAIPGVSIAVSTLILPLYFMAEKIRDAERSVQHRLKPEIEAIKTAFRGDERYMMLSTLYRQNHYHPVYALRNSAAIFIQIPFFIAAYHFLSHFEAMKGARFFFIKDLGAPDALLAFGGITVNILPILMTVVNIASE
jgi:membrane protein insertase Oxa1/YidC/SpoIIIJ